MFSAAPRKSVVVVTRYNQAASQRGGAVQTPATTVGRFFGGIQTTIWLTAHLAAPVGLQVDSNATGCARPAVTGCGGVRSAPVTTC